MNARWLTVVAVIVASAFLSSAAVQQTAAQLYQSGVYAEEIEGNLQKAIGIYEQVLKQFPSNRDTAANAQLHIGLCYERMGLERAREAFERVIKNYPGQAAAVAVARAKLDAIIRAASLSKKGEGDVTIRKVPTPAGTAVLGAVSPDGRYLADWGGDSAGNTCDLWISETLTGKQRFLTTEGKGCSQSAYGPRWSRDSTKLAYTWRSAGSAELRVVALDGSAPRVLVPGGEWGLIEVLDWSPDGKYLLAAVFYSQKPLALSLVNVADGSARALKTFAETFVLDCRFSPDGLYIAYSRPVGKGGNSNRTRDVFLLSADGSRESPLVQHRADDALLDWLPDGRGILFASDRAGTMDMWTIRTEKGLPQGVPTLVRRNMGPITPLGLTKAGSFYYRTPSSLMDVYTVSLDPQTGNVAGSPRKEPLPFEGHNRMPDWSPDGKRLAYVSARPTIVGPFPPGRAREWIVCVYSADTGTVREFRDERVFLEPRWSPDGHHLYVLATPLDGLGVYRMDVESGEVTPVPGAGVTEMVRYFQVSADGKWIVRKGSRILRRDARTGEEKELDRSAISLGNLALSPDGGHLAWILKTDEKTQALKVMQLPDGTPREIQRLTDSGGYLTWSPDGRFIYYSDRLPAGGSDWHLWRVPAEGGNAQDLGLASRSHLERLSVHPDGSRITFSGDTLNPERSQVWVMENFLPALKR